MKRLIPAIFGTCTVAFGITSASAGAPDLSGVWVVTKYDTQIKTTAGISPQFLPAAERIYNDHKASLRSGDISFDSTAQRCGPPGFPRIMMMPYAFEIVQNPRRVIFLFEWNRMYRRVDVNGPSLSEDDLQFTGRSTGQWQGSTFVIDVKQIDETLLDASGMPHSPDLTVTEHLRLRSDTLLEDRMQFTDAKTFREPWETIVTYRRLSKSYELKENICLDRLKTAKAIEDDNYLKYPK